MLVSDKTKRKQNEEAGFEIIGLPPLESRVTSGEVILYVNTTRISELR